MFAGIVGGAVAAALLAVFLLIVQAIQEMGAQ